MLASYESEQWPKNEKLIRGSHLLARVYALRGRAWTRTKLALSRVFASPLARGLVQPVVKTFLAGERDEAPRPEQLVLEKATALAQVDETYEGGAA